MWCVIPAAGAGKRMGFDCPKQYLTIKRKQTMLEMTIEAILKSDSIEGVVVALDAKDDYFKKLDNQFSKPVLTCIGGETRADSVYQGLLFLADKIKNNDFICVHDAARPLIEVFDIDRLHAKAENLNATSGVILVAQISDTIKLIDGEKVIKTVDRSNLYRALTPQIMRYDVLIQSLGYCKNKGVSITDEASALEACGHEVEVVFGSAINIKVTYPEDLMLVRAILGI